jgi:hypothetical protein
MNHSVVPDNLLPDSIKDNFVVFDSPRTATITQEKFLQFSVALHRMGLKQPEFRAVAISKDGNQVIVHHEDVPEGHATREGRPTMLNASLVRIGDPEI